MFWERSDSTLSDEVLRGLRVGPWPIGSRDVRAALDTIMTTDYRVSGGLRGTFNRCFTIQPCDAGGGVLEDSKRSIARFNINPNVSNQSLHLEQWVNNEAIARAFPTPRITHVDTSRRHSTYPFQLVEWADGTPLRGASEETVKKVLGQLGRELMVLHCTTTRDRFGRVGLGTVPEWSMFWMEGMDADGDWCLDHSLITDDQFDQIYDIGDSDARWFEEPAPSILHADLSYDNILISKTGDLSSVIDWEDAVLGDPIFELAGLATFHPIERHSCFIDTYYEGRDKPADFEYRFWVYYLRIALAKAVHRHRFGYVNEVKPGHQNPDDRIGLALSKLKDL